MLSEPIWVTPETVVRLNFRALEGSQEPHQLHSRSLLESACERPKNYWHYHNVTDVVELGCLLFFALARNHPFLQGNKRSAFAAMIGFFGANDYRFEIGDHTPNADYIVAAVEGRMTDREFIDSIRPGVVRS